MQFEATLGKLAIGQSKQDYYGQQSGGEMALTLQIKQPAPPRRPNEPYGLSQQPPELPKRKAKESDEEYEVRSRAARERLDDYESGRRRYAEQLAQFERDLVDFQPRLVAYMQLVGITAVFGNSTVRVTIEPTNQELLPGFEANLLPAPETVPGMGNLIRRAEMVVAEDPGVPEDEYGDEAELGEDE